MSRLCILTQYFPPEMGAPQARLSELAERLIERGWEVEALTALPNYPTGSIFPGYSPYQSCVETIGRVRTARVPLWPSRRGFVARVGTYTSFALAAAALGPRLCARPDLLWVESPPLFIVPAAWALARRWGCPYVLNVSDLWPESAVQIGAIGPRHPATQALFALETQAYRRAAAVTGQSTEIVAAVAEKAPGVPTCVITNGVDPSRFGAHAGDEAARDLVGREPGPIFVYAGLLGHAQGLDQILDGALALPPDVAARFVIVGDGPKREHLQNRIRDERITRVKLVPPQPRDRVPAILASADAALVTLGAALPGAVPSKIYEAMAAGLPVLLVAGGEPAARVRDARCGVSVAPGDVTGLRAAVIELARSPELRAELGRAGRDAAETVYHRDRIADRLDSFLCTTLEAA